MHISGQMAQERDLSVMGCSNMNSCQWYEGSSLKPRTTGLPHLEAMGNWRLARVWKGRYVQRLAMRAAQFD